MPVVIIIDSFLLLDGESLSETGSDIPELQGCTVWDREEEEGEESEVRS